MATKIFGSPKKEKKKEDRESWEGEAEDKWDDIRSLSEKIVKALKQDLRKAVLDTVIARELGETSEEDGCKSLSLQTQKKIAEWGYRRDFLWLSNIKPPEEKTDA